MQRVLLVTIAVTTQVGITMMLTTARYYTPPAQVKGEKIRIVKRDHTDAIRQHLDEHNQHHSATATSLFVLTITTLTGIATHVAADLYHHGIRRAFMLSIGAILGAQIGAKLSQHIHGDWIIRGLAVALGLVGIRLFVLSLQ